MIEQLKAIALAPLPDTVWDEVARAYATPPRAYHTLEHVLDVARQAYNVIWLKPREVFCAVLFHDAVYEVGRSDNEARSAELAARVLQGLVDVERVKELILLTARHGHLKPEDVDAEAALFLDCDMAILGASKAAFARYQQQIAQEYVPVIGEDAYRQGRQRFLQALLDQDRIFLSDFFHRRLNALARANLRSSLK
jgi:predicted metal-dependent HD superfamily phosphohydrolase